MLKLPDDITCDDIRQWLEGGVFYARNSANSPWYLATLRGVDDDRACVVRGITTGHDEVVGPASIRCHWPACGAINLPAGFALQVERLQRRQYRRTYNARCVRTFVPGKWQALKTLAPDQLMPDIHSSGVIEALFRPAYPANTYEARAMIEGGRVSVALNPQLILGKERVYYRGEYVGRMKGGHFYADCDETVALRIGKMAGALTCR